MILGLGHYAAKLIVLFFLDICFHVIVSGLSSCLFEEKFHSHAFECHFVIFK